MLLFTRTLLAGAFCIAAAQGASAFDSMIYLDAAGQYAGTAAVNSAIDQQRKELEGQKRQGRQQQVPALTERQAACAARYRTYDPRTDSYFVRPGVPAKCPL